MSEVEEIQKKLKERYNIEAAGKYADDVEYLKQLLEFQESKAFKIPRPPCMDIASEIIGQEISNFPSIEEKLNLIYNLSAKVGVEFQDPVHVAMVIGLYMQKK